VKTLFTAPLSEKSGQEKNQCLFCDHIILRNFSNRLMYFLGNDKNGGGSGYKGDDPLRSIRRLPLPKIR
jgi:hypothetical protein